MALADSHYVQGAIEAFNPDAIHIATEGPLGHYVRRYCIRRGLRFSTDVFVFPSKTDTFGLVMLEALASGTPVAAFNVAGPMDVVGASCAGALGADLRQAALRALSIRRETCRQYASHFSWQETAQQFIARLPRIGKDRSPERKPECEGGVRFSDPFDLTHNERP